jgi:hypothetical protein
MINQQPRICASNPDSPFNNTIHEDTLASFMVHLALNHQSGFNAVPVGSSDPILLTAVLEMIADRTHFRGDVDWIPTESPPFSIDISDATRIGLRPMKTSNTVTSWLDDAIRALPRS